MTDQQMIDQGVAEAERICAASRDLRGSAWPQVVGEYVAFHEGDRRFHIYDATTLYVELYLREESGLGWRGRELTLTAALKDENHVRELVEVITS